MASNLTESQRPSLWRMVLIGRQPKFTLVRIVALIAIIFFVRQYFFAADPRDGAKHVADVSRSRD